MTQVYGGGGALPGREVGHPFPLSECAMQWDSPQVLQAMQDELEKIASDVAEGNRTYKNLTTAGALAQLVGAGAFAQADMRGKDIPRWAVPAQLAGLALMTPAMAQRLRFKWRQGEKK